VGGIRPLCTAAVKRETKEGFIVFCGSLNPHYRSTFSESARKAYMCKHGPGFDAPFCLKKQQ
jgi:hypothetical protein